MKYGMKLLIHSQIQGLHFHLKLNLACDYLSMLKSLTFFSADVWFVPIFGRVSHKSGGVLNYVGTICNEENKTMVNFE